MKEFHDASRVQSLTKLRYYAHRMQQYRAVTLVVNANTTLCGSAVDLAGVLRLGSLPYSVFHVIGASK